MAIFASGAAWYRRFLQLSNPNRGKRAEARIAFGALVVAGQARAALENLKRGLDAPICLTWELTYACNLACVHCLSSSGTRDPNELTTAEMKAIEQKYLR